MKKSRQRMFFILLVLGCLGAAAGLSLYAVRDNLSFFYTPHEVKEKHIAAGQRFRLGGLVVEGSLKKKTGSPAVTFMVTDTIAEMRVDYAGILPDLFREGQGVVATGSLDDEGVFAATEILAKHDEKYMPTEVAKGLEDAARRKKK